MSMEWAGSKFLTEDLSFAQDVSRGSNHHLQLRLLFGHDETIVPFAALVGLFQEQQETVENKENEEPGKQGTEGSKYRLQMQEKEPAESFASLLKPLLNSGSVQPASSIHMHPFASDESAAQQKSMHHMDIKPPWKPSLTNNSERAWRGSAVGPFGSNFVMILYKAESKR